MGNGLKSVGRPRCFDEGWALDKAVRVFWEKGFEGASLSDLTKAMGIKPASLYAAFGNKRSLFRKALERYNADQLKFAKDALLEPTAFAVAERLLRQSAMFLTRPNFPSRCMTIQTISPSRGGTEINNELALLRTDAQKALRRRFVRAKREGDLPEQSSPSTLARFVMTVCQGMNIQRMNGATRKDLLDLVDMSLVGWPVNKRKEAAPGGAALPGGESRERRFHLTPHSSAVT